MAIKYPNYDSIKKFLSTSKPTITLRVDLPDAISNLHFAAPITAHELIDAIEQLTEHGIRSVGLPDTWNIGSYSILIPFTEKKQLLRISSRHEDRAYKEPPPFMLKPLISIDNDKLHMEVFPEVDTNPDHITEDHVRFLENLCLACGYAFWDIKKTSIGLLKGGLPVIFDQGAVCDREGLGKPLKLFKDELHKYDASEHHLLTFKKYMGQRYNPTTDIAKPYGDTNTLLADLLKSEKDETKKDFKQSIQRAYGRMTELCDQLHISHPPVDTDDTNWKPEANRAPKNAKDIDAKILLDPKDAERFLPIVERIYSGHQKEHVHALGLEYGKVQGAYDKKQLTGLFRQDPALASLIENFGLDERAFQRAKAEVPPNKDDHRRWSDRLAQKLNEANESVGPDIGNTR